MKKNEKKRKTRAVSTPGVEYLVAEGKLRFEMARLAILFPILSGVQA